MKEFVRKIIVILVLMMMLISNSVLLIISNAVDEIEKIIDESKINPFYAINLEKYVNYSMESEEGTLVQFNLKTGIEYMEGEEYSPLKSTGILLKLPEIEGEYPENIEVIGKSTKATNGSNNAQSFRYIYDNQNGEMKLAVVNEENENGDIYSENVDGARDEYTVICYYNSNCYNSKNDKRNLEITGFVQANVANENGTRRRVDIKENYEVAENISGLISTEVKTTDIYNGYINANSQNGTSYKTEYVENLEINVSKKEISDEIIIDTEHCFINENNKSEGTDEIIYKSTKISKDELLDLLGEEGFLQILDENNEILAEINKDTEVEENGIYEVTYDNELSKIIVKTSKPVKAGTIILQNEKQIKESMTNINNNRIQVRNNISCINNIEIKDEETDEVVRNEQKEIYNFSNENEIKIKDAESRIDLSVDKTTWTNNIQNEVVFTATLVTDNARYNLFSNPVIEIQLPIEVEKVILGDISVLYDNNLSVKNAEVRDTDNGKVIRIELDGTQDEYILNSIISGVNVLIPAIVIVRKDINSNDTNINYTYSNKNGKVIDYEIGGNNSKSLELEINSIFENEEPKLMTVTSNFTPVLENTGNVDDLETEVKMMLGDTELQNDDVVHIGEYIKYVVKLKNNSNEQINNIKIVGKVPEGTTYVDIKIIELTAQDINDSNYDRCREYEDISRTSYENIVNLKAKEEEEICYYVKVNDVGNINSNVKVLIDNNEQFNYNLTNNAKEAEMNVKLKAWLTEREENNLWLYQVVVKNNTNKDIENPVITMNLPETMKYKYTWSTGVEINDNNNTLIISLDKLSANSTKDVGLFIKIINSEDVSQLNVETVASVKGSNTDIYYSNINIQEVYEISFTVEQNSEKEGNELEYKEEVEYIFTIRNESKSLTGAENVELLDFLDENMNFESAEYECYTFDEKGKLKLTSNNLITAKIEHEEDEDVYILLCIPNKTEIKIKIKAKARMVSERTEVTNYAKIKYKKEIQTEEERTTQENIQYKEIIKNSNVIKNTVLPNVVYEDSNEPADIEEPEEPREPEEPEEPDQPEIPKNQYEIYNPEEAGKKDDKDETDETKNPTDTDNSDNSKEQEGLKNTTYRISGLVWNDSNKDGKRDDDEVLLKDITVKLFNIETNSLVTEKISTNQNGEYNFNNIEKGKYIILFEYDTNKYSITTYKKNGISDKLNSDVILKQVSIDGQYVNAGVTDTIDLNKNYSNIDMGLVENEEFDLSLNKSIVGVIANYGDTKKEYNFNESKLAKVEIPSKNISNAVLIVEYLIEIKNEGNASGNVDEIIDYIPEGFKFESTLNEGWYQKGSSSLTNTSLANTILKVGDSKYLKLYLTKNLTSDSIGKVVNAAEIGKSNSINGNKDMDSIAGNKNTSEDDYSEAELLISIKTGALLYTGIIIGILSILVILKILIDKKIINIKNIKLLSAIIILGIIILSQTNTGNAYGDAEAKAKAASSITLSTDTRYCWYDTNSPGHSSWTTSNATNYSHNYTHFDITGANKIPGVLYCTEGGAMATSSPGWAYTCTSYDSLVTGTINTSYSGTEPSITDENTSVTKKFNEYLDNGTVSSTYYKLGPYKVKYTGDIEEFKVYYKEIGGTENVVNSSDYFIVNNSNEEIDEPVSNKVFYIVLKQKYYWITKVHIKVKKEVTATYSFSANWREKWTTSGHEGSQVLGLDRSGNFTDTGSETHYAEVDLEGQRIPRGGLKIVKKDEYDDNACVNAKFKVTGPFGYSKTFTTDESGEIEIENLTFSNYWINGNSDNYSDDERYKYTIEEIGAPDGYVLSVQDPDKLLKTTALKKYNSDRTNQKKVNFTNRKVGKIKIRKIDQHGNNVEGAEFIIYYTDKNNKVQYITDNGSDSKLATISENKDNAKKFKTSSSGEIEVKGLLIEGITRKYTVEEISTPASDTLEYQPDSVIIENVAKWGKKGTVVVKPGEEAEFESINITTPHPQAVNLQKVDSSNNSYGLSGVEYKIQYKGKLTNNTACYIKITGNGIINNRFEFNGTDLKISKFSDIEFKSSASDATTFVTGDNGDLKIKNLPTGEYIVKEVKNTNYGYKQEQGKEINENISKNTESLKLNNTQILDNLEIHKVDSIRQDINLEGVEFKVAIEDGTTTKYLKLTKGSGSSGHVYAGETVESSVTINQHNIANDSEYHVDYETDISKATIFVTNSEGKININNLEVYYAKDKKYTYNAIEYWMGTEMAYYYDVKTSSEATTDKIELANNGNSTTLTVENRQLRIDLSGYVWEDIGSTKATALDNKYTEDGFDKKISNIPVTLKKDGSIIAVRETDENGYYMFKAKGNYNANGTGAVYTIDLYKSGDSTFGSGLEQYTIEFEYNGIKYESVLKGDVLVENTSKATENNDKRNGINDNFSTIQGGNSKNENGITKGSTSEGIDLTYVQDEEYKSTLIDKTSYRSDSAKSYIGNETTSQTLIQMFADIASVDIKARGLYTNQNSNNIWNIDCLNLGIYQREQPDLAIATDIENIMLSINGYTHTYEYKQRDSYIKDGVPDKDLNPEYDAIMDAFSVSVKNNSGNYKNLSYTREIYDSYIAYTKLNEDADNRLKVYVTYKVVIKNESSGLYSKVSLKNYTDNKYNEPEVYYNNNSGNKVNLECTGRDGVWEIEEIDNYIKYAQSMSVYFKYELNTQTIIDLVTNEVNIDKTVTEIKSYTTYKEDEDGNKYKYGGIDQDSAPNNITYDEINTYEDDTDVAPDLNFKRKNPKEISGLVFEDAPEENSSKERIGNGVYDDSKENKIENVKVELLKYEDDGLAKLYTIEEDGTVNNPIDAEAKTNDSGIYKFVGLIPDEYYIKYTYGYYDDSVQTKIVKLSGKVDVTTQNYKSTIVDKDKFETILDGTREQIVSDYSANSLCYWYEKEEYDKCSSAVDNYDKRKEINNALKDIDYKVETDYQNKTNVNLHSMNASTGMMDVAIEDYRNQTSDGTITEAQRSYPIYFGIIERPRQSIEVNKEIAYIKITLANGQELISGDPRYDNLDYVTYPENGGILKAEIDSEIIEGATLDLRYVIDIENKSENDYDTEEYYKYGKDKTNLVKLRFKAIVDYADEKLSLTYDMDNSNSEFEYYNGSIDEDKKWYITRKENGLNITNQIAGIDIDPDVFETIKTRTNVVVKNLENEEIGPGEKIENITMTAKKLLTDLGNTDQIFDNYVEVLKISNNVGRFYGDITTTDWKLGTPGNFNISKPDETNEIDNNFKGRSNRRSAQTTITPPTGTKSIMVYSLIALGCLIMLAGGIILIKKKVVDK